MDTSEQVGSDVPRVEPEELRARVAQRIRDTAKRNGISISRLADEAGVSRAHLWAVLNGESASTTDFLAKLAMVFNVDPVDLVRPGRKPKMPGE